MPLRCRSSWLLGLAASAVGLSALPAKAELRVCNRTAYLMNVALGYRGEVDYQTEGWWAVAAGACITPLRDPLASRYVYVYATDIDNNDVLSGTAPLCIEEQRFLIVGPQDCWRRGYMAVDFTEIDTLGEESWTVDLRDAAAPSP
jgi:uncharacterized membrane protein